MKNLYVLLSAIRLIPHLYLFYFHKNGEVMVYDLERWMNIKNRRSKVYWGFFEIMTYFPEFRNLFYHRVGKLSILINWLCPKMNTLFLSTNEIGAGLILQHGFSTIVAAKSIGKDCWINQQVTIGYSNATDQPTIEDNITINAGAKVIGNVTIGKGSVVEANAVVVKNVPENCTVVGVPAYIIRENGIKTKREL